MTWDLPRGWRWTPVGSSVARVAVQVQPDAIHDDVLYIGLEHVRSGTGEYSGVEAGGADIRSHKFTFQPGDILYGKLRPNLRKCVVVDQAGVCSTDLVPLRPIDPGSAHFLAMQLRSEAFTADVMRIIGGANLPRVNIRDLFTLSLPTPPEADASRLYEIARSVSTLRRRQRMLEYAVLQLDSAATASALGRVSVSAPIRQLSS